MSAIGRRARRYGVHPEWIPLAEAGIDQQIELVDLECPSCRARTRTWSQMGMEYGGTIEVATEYGSELGMACYCTGRAQRMQVIRRSPLL